MKTYAKEHGWEFEEGDFEFAKSMSVVSSGSDGQVKESDRQS